MKNAHYDAAVIDSGQGGTPLSGAIAEAGWSIALTESEHVGGTCVNEGCTPTKTMVASACGVPGAACRRLRNPNWSHQG
jgi:pyruvate/2-oxoglutarate dehydrogenase complex dihydrolipoamide dehydrogenase (E3) component